MKSPKCRWSMVMYANISFLRPTFSMLLKDAISILRSCLGPEPAKLVEGISTDLKSAWNYLDQNYGDSRIVSDVVTSDIERFKAVQTGEDHRFCDLVDLVRGSYNILKDEKACFSCLKRGKGHTSANCLLRKTWSEKNKMAQHVRSPTINSCTYTVEKNLAQCKSPRNGTRVWRYFR